jgi:hypothetical protein
MGMILLICISDLLNFDQHFIGVISSSVPIGGKTVPHPLPEVLPPIRQSTRTSDRRRVRDSEVFLNRDSADTGDRLFVDHPKTGHLSVAEIWEN